MNALEMPQVKSLNKGQTIKLGRKGKDGKQLMAFRSWDGRYVNFYKTLPEGGINVLGEHKFPQ
jgi:hypothetical protein